MAEYTVYLNFTKEEWQLGVDDGPVLTDSDRTVLYSGDNEMIARIEYQRAKQKLKG
jgi:hypothetical protein